MNIKNARGPGDGRRGRWYPAVLKVHLGPLVSDSPASPDPSSSGTNTFLAGYRNRIMYWFAIIAAVGVTPFAVSSLLARHFTLGGAILTVVILLAIDAIAIHNRRHPPIPFQLLLLPLAVSVGISLATQGVYGALWCYPMVLFCYFVLSWRWAISCSLVLLAAFTPLVYHFIDPGVAIRFGVTLAVTIVGINVITRIITDLQAQLVGQIITDPLTGAFNRRHMNMSLADAIERHRRTGATASVLIIDIDHFKRVNDDFGHPVGDKVLKGMVALIQQKSRKLDRLFRMGGEEFLLFLPDTKANDAVKRAENLRQDLADAPLLAQRPVTASIGVSEIADDTVFDTWVSRADQALYKAKQGGRNRVVCAETPPSAAADSDAAE
jgi:diguanylate cyclase (GGDEF)-like protein